jgi:peptidylprolyl isomerase
MSDAIQNGDTILVNYTGKFENGEVFDTSEGGQPLKFTVGSGQIIKGFDDAVLGMMVGDKKSVVITATDGYGEHNEELVFNMPKSHVPEGMELKAGMEVELLDQDKHPVYALCTEVFDDIVRIDVNHPLAGKTLLFDIEIVESGLEPDAHSCTSCDCDCGH